MEKLERRGSVFPASTTRSSVTLIRSIATKRPAIKYDGVVIKMIEI